MKMTKIAAIVAAAALLVIGVAFTSMAADKGWVAEEDGWTYQDADGERYTDCFKASGNNWYWLGEDGVMATDQLVVTDNGTYYVGSDGARVSNAWAKVYDEDDEKDYWYFFGSNCKAVTGKKDCPVSNGAAEKATFLFDDEYHMLSGWVAEVASASVVTGYEAGDDEQNTAYVTCDFYCGDADDGKMVKGDWRELEIADDDATTKDAWFYFAKGGKKYKNEDSKKIGDKKYSFNAAGVMKSGAWNTSVAITAASASEVRRYDESGALVTGWFKAAPPQDDEADEHWYYANKNGELACNELMTIKGTGKSYAFNEKAEMLTGLQLLKFDASGSNAFREPADVIDAWWTAETWSTIDEIASDKDGYYFFGSADDADSDGAMKTGDAEVTVGDETKTLTFLTSGAKGRARDGYDTKGKKYYANGIKLAASDDDGIQICVISGTTITKKTAAELQSGGAPLYKKSGAGYKLYAVGRSVALYKKTGENSYAVSDNGFAVASSNYIAINTQGSKVTATKEDANGYKIEIAKKTDGTAVVTGVYTLY